METVRRWILMVGSEGGEITRMDSAVTVLRMEASGSFTPLLRNIRSHSAALKPYDRTHSFSLIKEASARRPVTFCCRVQNHS